MHALARSAAASATVAGVLAVTAGPAAAAPPGDHVGNPRAACPGLALSEHAENDEPGAVAQINQEGREIVQSFGFDNLGQFLSRWAQVHAGTHDPGREEAVVAIVQAGPPR